MVIRGDVCWADLPDAGRRPVLILTRDEAIPVLNRVTVALLTSTIREIPTEVRLGLEDGLPKECVVSLDNIRDIGKALIAEPIASLRSERMREVCGALAAATGCDYTR